MTKSTSGGCGQFETSPETFDPELRTAFCERGQTDRLKTNYSVDYQKRTQSTFFVTPSLPKEYFENVDFGDPGMKVQCIIINI